MLSLKIIQCFNRRTLSYGFNSSKLEKYIFSFDKIDKKNGIIITKLYSLKQLYAEEEGKTNIFT